MTIIKHRANFAELIAQAAAQKKNSSSKADLVHQLVQSLHRQAAADAIESSEEYGTVEEDERPQRSSTSSERSSSILKSGLSSIISAQPTLVVKAKGFQVSYYAYKLIESMPFRTTRFVFILLAFLLLAFDTDKVMREKPIKNALDSVVDVFFIAIGIMKFISLHFRNSMIEHVQQKMSVMGMIKNSGFLNISISICSLIFVSYPSIGGWFRLLRVCILTGVELNQIPQIDVLMSGMILGARSLASTWMLLSLVFLVYSTLCVTLFQESDPFHFGSIPMAMWTFFELSTFDNWSIVLYINWYGCDAFPSYYYDDFSQYSSNSTSFYKHGEMFLPVCLKPQESRVLAPLIFTSFILICGFILISLTVAAVTGGINDRLKCIEQEGLTRAMEETAAQSSTNKTIVQDHDMLFAMLKKVWTHQETITAQHSEQGNGLTKGLSMLGHGLKSMVSFRKPVNSEKNFKPKVKGLEAEEKAKTERKISLFRKLSGGSPSPPTSGHKVVAPQHARRKSHDRDSMNRKKNKNKNKLESPLEYNEDIDSSKYFADDKDWAAGGLESNGMCLDCLDKRFLGLYMRDVTHGPLYNFVLMVLVCGAAFLEIWTTQTNVDVTPVEVLQIVLQILFSVDIIFRILSHYPNYRAYGYNNWNVFDFVLVFLTWFPIFTVGNEVLGLLRVLRILRILRLLNDIADLNIILQAIGSSASALFYVTMLMLLFFYIFAVAGVFLFSQNDFFHFGSLGRAFVCLYQVSTLDDWGQVARTNMYGCDKFGYDTGNSVFDAYCENPEGFGYVASMYFGVFIVFGVYVLISLFVGIIITSMELLRDSIKEEDEVWGKVRENQEEFNWKDSMVENLLEIFNSMDIEQNGKLTLNELKPILKIVHVTETDQFSLFMRVDKDSSGQIDFAEFLELVHLIGIAYRDVIRSKKAIVPNMQTLKKNYSVRAMSMFGKPSVHSDSTPPKNSCKNSRDNMIFPDPTAAASPAQSAVSGPLMETLEDGDEDEADEGGISLKQQASDLSLFSTGSGSTVQVIATGPMGDRDDGEEEGKSL